LASIKTALSCWDCSKDRKPRSEEDVKLKLAFKPRLRSISINAMRLRSRFCSRMLPPLLNMVVTVAAHEGLWTEPAGDAGEVTSLGGSLVSLRYLRPGVATAAVLLVLFVADESTLTSSVEVMAALFEGGRNRRYDLFTRQSLQAKTS
jgi:hypothetical protein